MILGILGGVGSGKSTVAGLLAELGAEVLDADRIAHEVLEEDNVKDTIRGWWGDEVFDETGHIDRAAIAERVFREDAERRRLERLVHPRVGERINRGIDAFLEEEDGSRLLVLDIPLLADSPIREHCDEMIFIETDSAQRQIRTRVRGWSGDELKRRESAQSPISSKRKLATRVLDNRTGMPELRRQVEELYESLLEIPRQEGN